MVSIGGYAIGELIMAAVGSYVLLGMIVLMYAARLHIEDRLANERWRFAVICAGAFIVLQVLMMMDVRIGTVMFINGALSVLLGWQVRSIARWWRETDRE